MTLWARPVGDDAPRIHAHEALGHLKQDMHDMLDPDDRDPAGFQFENDVDEFVRLGVGQAAADLVQQQHCGAGGERAGELEPLAIDESERLRAPVGDGSHAGQRKRVDRRLIGAFMLEPAAMRGGGEDILEHRHAAEGPRNLMRARQPPPASLRRRRGGDVLAEKAHPPAGRRMRADQQAEQGRLAGAVRPDDAHRLAGADGKVDPVEHHEGAEAFRQAFRLEQKAVRSRAGRHAPRPISC